MDGVDANAVENGKSSSMKESSHLSKSPGTQSPPNAPIDAPEVARTHASIEKWYDNVHEIESSADGSSSRVSFRSDAAESRIDSELHHLVGGQTREIEIMEEVSVGEQDVQERVLSNGDEANSANWVPRRKSRSHSSGSKSGSFVQSKKPSPLPLEVDAVNLSSKNKGLDERISIDQETKRTSIRRSPGHLTKQRSLIHGGASKIELQNVAGGISETELDNPDLGPYLLKQARDLISSGDNPQRALNFAVRAAKSFEKCMDGKSTMDLVMSWHVAAAIHCSLGQYDQAIPILQCSIEILTREGDNDHALAKFSGYMQLGDTYAMIGSLENSIRCYTLGLGVQRQALGDSDLRVAETCRYLAEAHVQALQFNDAKNVCQMALDIHKEFGSPGSIEEAADRRLMGLICDMKGDHEAALEHLVLAGMAMASNDQGDEVALVDCSIGDTYLSLARYDEAVFAYQKALTAFKTSKGDNHPNVASVFVRLADLYNRTGKMRDSKSFCENALLIYNKPALGSSKEEIASGYADIAAIYESMNEPEEALSLLLKALKIYNDVPGQQSTIAGIEAQMGVIYYMIENYSDSYISFKNAIAKLRASGDRKSGFFGVALNQMGLVCVQRYAINEAVDLFEEARHVLEQEYGPYHPDTLGVYSNLAGTYDAMGR